MHQAAIKSLGLVGDELKQKSSEKKLIHYEYKGKRSQKNRTPQSQKTNSPGDEDHEARRKDARNIIAQSRVNKARYAWNEEKYEDDKKEMGALCFTRRVRRTRVPKGFKLPHVSRIMMGRKNPGYGY
jgi:hypothetical protein